MNAYRSSLFAGAALATVAGVAQAQTPAPAQINFSIAPGPLGGALNAYASQAGRQLMFTSDQVAGRRTQGLSGRMTPDEALNRLLSGSGLTAVRSTSGAWVLQRVTTEELATTTLEEVVVTGTLLRGPGDTPSPVTVIRREDLDRAGRATVAEALAALPQNYAGSGTPTAALVGSDPMQSNSGLATGVNPKVGLIWSPLADLTMRANWGTSFRAPAMVELAERRYISATFVADTVGQQVALFEGGGNPDLKPETAETFTIGFDYRPADRPWRFGATWFDIDFSDQIGRPALDNLTQVLLDPNLAPFVRRIDRTSAADRAAVDALITSPAFLLPGVLPADAFGVIVDARWLNTASVEVRGLDANAAYDLALAGGALTIEASASYMTDFARRITTAAPSVDLVDTYGFPVDLRGTLSGRWVRDEPLPGLDLSPNLMTWSPSGRRLLVWVRQDGQSWSEGRLVEIDPQRKTVAWTSLHGRRPALVQTGLRTEVICADWLGDRPMLYVQGEARRDWVRLGPFDARVLTRDLASPSSSLLAVSRSHIAVQSGGEVWSVDQVGHALRLGQGRRVASGVTTALFSQGQRFQFNSPTRQDWVLVGEGNGIQRRRLIDGAPLGEPLAGERIVAIDESQAAVVQTDGVREILSRADGARLARINDHLSGVVFASPEAVGQPSARAVSRMIA